MKRGAVEGAGRENIILESHVDNGVSLQQIIKPYFRQFWGHGRNAMCFIWQKFPLQCILLNIGKERICHKHQQLLLCEAAKM